MLDASSNARVVRLFSAGGYVKVAGAIRNDIRERRMDTIVSGVCASACTIAFMAGERRLFVKGARLGFHSFTLGGKESDRTTREMELHYGYFGTNQNFIDRIALTPATAIWFPTAEELVNAQVVTEVLAPSSKSRWW